MNEVSTVRVWIEVEAVRSDWSWNKDRLAGVKLGRMLKKPPKQRKPDTHMVQVDIAVPWTAFEHKVKVDL